MSARSIWNGTLSFGSVNVPVKVFSATDRRGLSFREVRESDGARIEHRRIGSESGEPVEFKETEKAYDDDTGLVVLTKEEIAAADGGAAKVIAIEHFVRAEEIDPAIYDVPYHLGSRDGGAHAYRVLLAALEKAERVGIGRFTLRSRERLVAIRPLQGALGMQTMRFGAELVDPSDLELPSLKKAPRDREVDMASRLVDMLVGEWDPGEYEDEYRAAVMELVDAKLEGREPEAPPEREEPGDDLMAALEASLGEEGSSGGGKGAKAKSSGGSSKGSAGKGAKAKAKTSDGSSGTRTTSKGSGANGASSGGSTKASNGSSKASGSGRSSSRTSGGGAAKGPGASPKASGSKSAGSAESGGSSKAAGGSGSGRATTKAGAKPAAAKASRSKGAGSPERIGSSGAKAKKATTKDDD